MNLLRKLARRFGMCHRLRDEDAWIQAYPANRSGTRAGIRRICNSLLEQTKDTVFGGPFAGMSLPPGSPLRDEPNVILGSYEEEIHDLINEIVCQPPSCVIDIGSAQGLYVVGLARLIHGIDIFAFEMNEGAWPGVESLAKANSVGGRIKQHGVCTVDSLNAVMSEGAFVLCDCEGAEEDLLDPMAVPCLRSARIVCELHDFYRPELTATLVDRFRASHVLEIRCEQPRSPDSYRILRNYPPALRSVICDETRHTPAPFQLVSGRFMIMRPRTASR